MNKIERTIEAEKLCADMEKRPKSKLSNPRTRIAAKIACWIVGNEWRQQHRLPLMPPPAGDFRQ